MPTLKQRRDLERSVKVLEHALESYESGFTEAHLNAAAQLRRLLHVKDGLLQEAWPEFRLFKLHMASLLEEKPELAKNLKVMASGSIDGAQDGNRKLDLRFADPPELMPPDPWVKQPFLNPEIEVLDIILGVANKEALHSPPDYSSADKLRAAKAIKFIDQESQVPSIMGIADYVTHHLREDGRMPV